MKTFVYRIEGERRASGLMDATGALEGAVRSAAVRHGRVTAVAETTRDRLLVNERESGLFSDLKHAIARMGSRVAGLIGTRSLTLPVRDGSICLGEWQRVLVIAPEGEASGTVSVHVIGE